MLAPKMTIWSCNSVVKVTEMTMRSFSYRPAVGFQGKEFFRLNCSSGSLLQMLLSMGMYLQDSPSSALIGVS